MTSSPRIHILNKDDYTSHHLVSLPSTSTPSSHLPPSSLLVKSTLLSLTANNLSYARMGRVLGWFDVYPLPNSTPSPYNDPETYGRIAAWGYGDILASTVDAAPVGHRVYGYLPIGTLPTVLEMQSTMDGRHLLEISKQRAGQMPLYNRYIVRPAASEGGEEGEVDRDAYDALVRPVFEASYLTNLLTFSVDMNLRTAPWPDSPMGTALWGPRGDLNDATLYILGSSSKTGHSLAYLLKHERPTTVGPVKVIGLTSKSSKTFVSGSGFYDEVAVYEDMLSKLSSSEAPSLNPPKTILIDFGAPSTIVDKLVPLLRERTDDFVWLGIGGEAKQLPREEMMKNMAKGGPPGRSQFNASPNRIVAMQKLGEERYFEGLEAAWKGFIARGGVPGLTLKRCRGMEEWEKGWERVCRMRIAPEEGLVFEL